MVGLGTGKSQLARAVAEAIESVHFLAQAVDSRTESREILMWTFDAVDATGLKAQTLMRIEGVDVSAARSLPVQFIKPGPLLVGFRLGPLRADNEA